MSGDGDGDPTCIRPRILVAEDDGALCRGIARVLESAGFDVDMAENGVRATTLLGLGTYDAVLTDVRMPGMSGVGVLRAARERDLELPVLLMTIAPDLDSALEALRHGASDYITKPVDMALLERKLRRAVEMNRLAKAKRTVMRVLGSARPEAGDRAGLQITLDRALASLWIAYQPIVDVSTQTVFGQEALLRSREPALPHPSAVLDAAERLGRVHDVGRAVRREAPGPMAETSPSTLLFVNLHSSDLMDATLSSASSPLTAMASRVVLEITERASLDDVTDVRGKVAELRLLGFRIALDDLGAGYAGLTSLAELEPEFVKLDMSLVRDIHRDPVKQKLVQSMISMCREMGMQIIAEGIEVAAERDALVGMGCNLLQGYLFARPGPPFPDVSF
jgi:EAL domain-containing protein (putative c-di-GMP-specific phosphodiesterase class I)